MNSELTAQFYEHIGAASRQMGSNRKMRDERTPRQTPEWWVEGWRVWWPPDRVEDASVDLRALVSNTAKTAIINVFDGRRVNNSLARLVSTR